MTDRETLVACTKVDPGICGFPCIVKAQKKGARTVSIEISGSECEQIKKLSELVQDMSLMELFKPITRNPVMISAQKSGCHTSCAIPLAILKTVEVAMEMALPRDVKLEVSKNGNRPKVI
jgi:hypothetical protein